MLLRDGVHDGLSFIRHMFSPIGLFLYTPVLGFKFPHNMTSILLPLNLMISLNLSWKASSVFTFDVCFVTK